MRDLRISFHFVWPAALLGLAWAIYTAEPHHETTQDEPAAQQAPLHSPCGEIQPTEPGQ